MIRLEHGGPLVQSRTDDPTRSGQHSDGEGREWMTQLELRDTRKEGENRLSPKPSQRPNLAITALQPAELRTVRESVSVVEDTSWGTT